MLITHWTEAPLNGSTFYTGPLSYLFSTLGCGILLPNKDSGSQEKSVCSFNFTQWSYLPAGLGLRSRNLVVELSRTCTIPFNIMRVISCVSICSQTRISPIFPQSLGIGTQYFHFTASFCFLASTCRLLSPPELWTFRLSCWVGTRALSAFREACSLSLEHITLSFLSSPFPSSVLLNKIYFYFKKISASSGCQFGRQHSNFFSSYFWV